MMIHWTGWGREGHQRFWAASEGVAPQPVVWCGNRKLGPKRYTPWHFHRDHGFFNDGKQGFGGTRFSDHHIFFIQSYGYGSIPIDTFLVGWTSIYQLFWGSLGTRVLTHSHILMVICFLPVRLNHSPWVSGNQWISMIKTQQFTIINPSTWDEQPSNLCSHSKHIKPL